MNTHRYIMAVVMASVCIVRGAAAQETGPNREADHEALRALKTEVTAAINAEDIDKLGTFFAEEFVFTPANQVVITSRKQLKEFYRRIYEAPDSVVAKLDTTPKADILTRFTGPDTGYCYGHSINRYTLKNKRVFTLTNRWTALLRREDGEWKIAAAHVGVDFLDNPVLEASSMGFWKKVGVALRLVDPPWDKAE